MCAGCSGPGSSGYSGQLIPARRTWVGRDCTLVQRTLPGPRQPRVNNAKYSELGSGTRESSSLAPSWAQWSRRTNITNKGRDVSDTSAAADQEVGPVSAAMLFLCPPRTETCKLERARPAWTRYPGLELITTLLLTRPLAYVKATNTTLRC